MSNTVFLGNLPAWVTADDIKSWLSAENLVADSIKVIRNPETQESKGFAFIEAPNVEEMNSIIRRFDRAPKPMYYQPEFLEKAWVQYRVERGLNADEVNPDDFVRWTYAQALNHRQPRYSAMARNWGVTVKAEEVATVRDHVDLTQLIAAALDRRMP